MHKIEVSYEARTAVSKEAYSTTLKGSIHTGTSNCQSVFPPQTNACNNLLRQCFAVIHTRACLLVVGHHRTTLIKGTDSRNRGPLVVSPRCDFEVAGIANQLNNDVYGESDICIHWHRP